MSSVVVVIAHWQTEHEEEVLGLLRELKARSLEEPGCLGYEVLRGEPGAIVLIERYRDHAAIETHRAAPHYREILVERILPMLIGRRVELLEGVESPAP